MIRIVSSIPGRLRLRVAAPGAPAALDRLRSQIEQWEAVGSVAINPRTGSLLVHYDATRLTAARLEECARAAAATLARAAAKVGSGGTALPPRTHGGTPRVRPNAASPTSGHPPADEPLRSRSARKALLQANRLAKRGMLASLALSLVLAALGNKRGHWLAGALFLHALAVHLWAHRRHLFR